MEKNKEYQSGIIGKAQACFGGKIFIELIKARTKKEIYGIILSEAYQKAEVGTPPVCQEFHEPQVIMYFDTVKSVDMMEEALMRVREKLKRATEEEYKKKNTKRRKR